MKLWLKTGELRLGDIIWMINDNPDEYAAGKWSGWLLDGSVEEKTVEYIQRTRPRMYFYVERTEVENEFGPVTP